MENIVPQQKSVELEISTTDFLAISGQFTRLKSVLGAAVGFNFCRKYENQHAWLAGRVLQSKQIFNYFSR